MALTAASVSVQPTIAASWVENQIFTAQVALQRVVRFSALAALSCGIPLFAFSNFIASFYGPQFKGAGDLLKILVLGQVINALTGPLGAVLMMTGNQKQLFYFDLVFLTLKVVIITIGIHYFGIVGAALGEVLYLALMRVAGVAYTYRQTGLITMLWRVRSES
jgi:O-antigen/teichoic acid export membrane protein